MLKETADDVLHVQCKSFVRVPERFGFQLQATIIFAFALCRFEFFRERTGARGVVHKIGLAKVPVESLFAKKKLEALVILHQPGVSYTGLQQGFLQLLDRTPTHILKLG